MTSEAWFVLAVCLLLYVGIISTIWLFVDYLISEEFFETDLFRWVNRIQFRPIRVIARLFACIVWPVWATLVVVGFVVALAVYSIAAGATGVFKFLVE